jgi:Predicted HD superfamily hydrolase
VKTNNLVLVHELGKEILASDNMKREKRFIQHANVSTYEHSIGVATMSLTLAAIFRVKVDKVSLVRGALLHDFFLYDWHDKTAMPKAHAYLHPLIAFDNAKKEFKLNAIEKNIIQAHMFPLSIVMPKYKESWIVVMADKICAMNEIASNLKLKLVGSLLRNN